MSALPMTADLVARLERCAESCDPYSPDVCGTLIEGIGHVAMRALLREAASALRSSGEAVGSYSVRRDAHGFADGIERDGTTILHFIPGTVLNEANAESVVAALNATPASAWRPIAEAPRDGTRILVTGTEIGTCVASAGRSTEAPENIRWEVVNDIVVHPTEWQPLPPTSTNGG